MSKVYLAVAAASFALATVIALSLGAMIAYERVASPAIAESEPPRAQMRDRTVLRQSEPRS
ncbi:MAG: hypothetical protein AAGB04_07300 [Pseudomonadota bacterium]